MSLALKVFERQNVKCCGFRGVGFSERHASRDPCLFEVIFRSQHLVSPKRITPRRCCNAAEHKSFRGMSKPRRALAPVGGGWGLYPDPDADREWRLIGGGDAPPGTNSLIAIFVPFQFESSTVVLCPAGSSWRIGIGRIEAEPDPRAGSWHEGLLVGRTRAFAFVV